MHAELPARAGEIESFGERKRKNIGDSDCDGDRSILAVSAIRSPEDSLISERVVRVVRKRLTSVGIISSHYGTASWQVGALGCVKWIVSDKQFPAPREHDPCCFKSFEPIKLEAVEIIIADGSWDSLPSLMWKLQDLKIVVWVKEAYDGGRKRKRRRGNHSIPQGWAEKKRHRFRHNDVGGVTNGIFVVSIFGKEDATADWSLPSTVTATLRDALDPTVSGFRNGPKLPPPAAGEANSYRGLLNWKDRHAAIIAPTVYHDGGVMRKLKQKELANAMDFPADRTAEMMEQQLQLLTKNVIPGKVYYAAMYFLSSYDDLKSNSARSRKRDATSMGAEEYPHYSGGKRMKNNGPRYHSADCFVHDVGDFDGEETRYQSKLEVPFQSWIRGLELKGDDDDGGTAVENDVKEGEPSAKAVKSDDSKVPVHLWNDRIIEKLKDHWDSTGKGAWRHLTLEEGSEESETFCNLLDLLRGAVLDYWKRKVRRDFDAWFESTGKFHPEADEVKIDGEKAVRRAEACSFWEWDKGSSILFWRWPEDYQHIARTGIAPMFESEPPKTMEFQPPYPDDDVKMKVKTKIQRVIDRGYIEITDIQFVEALMYVFHVPKGLDDIRMVYDGSKSGLNACLYAPWFALPTADTMTRWVVTGSWLADNDFGDCFLNFPLSRELQKFCGVDVTHLFPELAADESQKVIGVWLRNAMGLTTSPYASCQAALRAKQIVIGDRKDHDNAYQWEKLLLNLPFAEDYVATLPRIRKVRRDGGLASEVIQYVDDLRLVACSAEQAWLASSQVAKGLCWLGLQDAARKRRRCSQKPGAWAGCLIATDDPRGVTKYVTEERWCKFRTKIRWIGKQLNYTDEFTPESFDDISEEFHSKDSNLIHFKTTEKLVGFIVYVCQTYKYLVPYLKGIYLTLNSWRKGRDSDGWMKPEARAAARKGEKNDDGSPPVWVRVVRRLHHDIKALMALTAYKDPPKLPIRARRPNPVFVVGDSSGPGFGSVCWTMGDTEFDAEYGRWIDSVAEKQSSNFREGCNLVQRIQSLIDKGDIPEGSEVFILTDNQVAESVFYKGSCNSVELHNLVVQLRKLGVEKDLILHVVWIAGKRMIETGVDGLSRGDFASGVMAGGRMLKYLPFNLSAFERSPELKWFVKSWVTNSDKWEFITTEGWFDDLFNHHDENGKFDAHSMAWIWAPPPVIAQAAVEQLCEAKHLFPASSHIFVCPAVMTAYWRKMLGKVSDTMFTVKAGSCFWKTEMYEPLTIAFIKPLLSVRPFKVGRLPSVDKWEREVRQVQFKSRGAARNHMCKFWSSSVR